MKPGREREIPGSGVIEHVNGRQADTVDYCNYRLVKRSSRYDENVIRELQKTANKMAV